MHCNLGYKNRQKHIFYSTGPGAAGATFSPPNPVAVVSVVEIPVEDAVALGTTDSTFS